MNCMTCNWHEDGLSHPLLGSTKKVFLIINTSSRGSSMVNKALPKSHPTREDPDHPDNDSQPTPITPCKVFQREEDCNISEIEKPSNNNYTYQRTYRLTKQSRRYKHQRRRWNQRTSWTCRYTGSVSWLSSRCHRGGTEIWGSSPWWRCFCRWELHFSHSLS